MAAPFLLVLLLVASGVVAAGGDDDGARLPHLELPAGTPDSGRGHVSDAPPPLQGLMDIMSMSGCGSFAGLLAATPNASDIFQQHLVAGGGGLTVFCPDVWAIAAFEPNSFRDLADNDQIALLLHHGAAGRYVRAQLAGFEWVAVPTLADGDGGDAATSKRQTVLVRDSGDAMTLWPTWPQDCGARVTKKVSSEEVPLVRDSGDAMMLWPTWPQECRARVTKTVSSEEVPLVLHVVDAVLLRRKLDGGDEAAAPARGGYLRWLHYSVPMWLVLWVELSVFVGNLFEWLVDLFEWLV